LIYLLCELGKTSAFTTNGLFEDIFISKHLEKHTVQRDVSVEAWIWHHPFEMCILICVALELKSKYCLQTSLLLLSQAYHLYDKKSHQSHHLSHLIDTVVN
jgi:hypothetical protein